MSTSHTFIATNLKSGPNVNFTGTITDVTGVSFDLINKRLFVSVDTVAHAGNPKNAIDNIRELDLNPVTAVTVAITAGAYAVTVV